MTMDENIMYNLEEFIHVLLASLWWLQSSEISSGGVICNPQTLAAISMHDHALILVLLIHARSIILE